MHNITSHDHLLIPDVWLKLTPAKTELFIWFAMPNRLLTREWLFNIGLCPIASNIYAFYGKFGESADHILLTCIKSWKL